MSSENEIYGKLAKAVVDGEAKDAKKYAKEALKAGMDAYETIMNGLAKGMEKVGELYEKREYYVPDLMISAKAMYAGLDVLQPHIKINRKGSGKVVIGVVEGDIHDIGKNLVKAMLIGTGYSVTDLGCDVSLEKFVEAARETNAEIIAMSALMTSTMENMKKIIVGLREKEINAKIIVGGAPLNAEIAKKFGADGYADNAVLAIGEIKKLREAAKK